MSRHKDLFQTINSLEADEIPYAIASVFEVHGSSSGKVGDKAIFGSKGNRIIGYIGGGCIENRVAETAKESLKDGQPRTIEIQNTEFSKNISVKIKAEDGNLNHIGSPLPGQVANIFVNAGDKIIKGDRVLVIEAMKMETIISAEKSGTIKKLHVGSGDNVETKDLLIEIE